MAINLPLFSQQENDLRELQVLGDTLFQSMSIEELIKIQKNLKKKVENLKNEEESIRDRGLGITESFIKKEGENIKDQDKILIRVAEYYIEEAENSHLKAMDSWMMESSQLDEKYKMYEQGLLSEEPVPPEMPKINYDKAIEVYDKILTDYQNSEYADDALYAKAFLLEEMDQGPTSRRLYQEVIDKYPESHFAAQSYMQIAEYYFEPRDNKDDEMSVSELYKALKLYKNILHYKDSNLYDQALYKIGWTYYKLAARDPAYYSDALVYFLAVVDDIEKSEEIDPNNKISDPRFRQEAIQYIGIIFADDESYKYAGVNNARRFLERIGERKYSVEIMRELGDYYQKIGKNENAIDAYASLLDMFPQYPRAPLIKQKIADAQFDLGMDDRMYTTQFELFENYNEESEWYANLSNSDLPDKLTYQQAAIEQSRKALYSNIVMDLTRAEQAEPEDAGTLALWQNVADHSKLYIDFFNKDSTAYEVNWNYAQVLELKLANLSEAFEQYMIVSNDYLRTEHQNDAATNAIFVADSLMKRTSADTGLKEIDFDAPDAASPDALNEDEKRYIAALNNYIKLFPNDKETPRFLAAAGAVYFNHRQFTEAKTYFNTLVNRFPGAEQKSIAMRSIMNSYFALGNFQDSEFIAKKILASEDLSAEERVFAEKRLAQSIFKNAKLYEDQKQFLEAALEYRRVYQEAPEEKDLADVALYNSGRMFEEIQEWEKAIESYNMLIDNFPNSRYMSNALTNTAEDYKELKQFSNAGEVYERIFELSRDNTEVAQNNLLYASNNYEKGENWNSAIRVNNLFISTFPTHPIGTELYFANAGHFLKLGNIDQANIIYAEFAEKYPDDPRAVEAFYKRGLYYKENQRLAEAKAEFNKAITKSEEFNRRGLDPNRYMAGESLKELVNMLHDEFIAIELKQPQSNIEARTNRLTQLLNEIVESNHKIVANASVRSFEAIYKSAEIFEEYANIYLDQERKSGLSKDELIVENKRINEESALLYEKAVDQYKEAYQNIPLVADKFGIDLFAPDTIATTVEEDSVNAMGEVVVDSTKQVALKWYNKSSEKISSLLYKKAELTKQNVNQLLSATIQGNTPLEKVSFKNQLLINAVAPAIGLTIGAHQRNIQEATELNLTNKYVEESKRQIILTNNILAQEVENLAMETLDLYKPGAQNMETLAGQGDSDDIIAQYMQANNLNLNFIEVSKELGVQAMNNYAGTLAFADQSGIQNDLVKTTENRLFRFAYELSSRYAVLKKETTEKRELYAQKFQETNNYNFDDMSAFYTEYEFSFSDFEVLMLENAFNIKEQYQVQNDWTKKIIYRLVKLDPVTYAESIEKEKLEVYTNENWVYSEEYVPGFTTRQLDVSNWKPVNIKTDALNQFMALNVNPNAIWIEVIGMGNMTTQVTDSLMTDSLQVSSDSLNAPADTAFAAADTTGLAPDSLNFANADTVYFRTTIDLKGSPVDGVFYLTADDDYKFWINEEYMIDDAEEDMDFGTLDTLTYSDISFGIKEGKNVLSFEVIDFDNSGGGVKLYGYIEYLPAQVTLTEEDRDEILLNIDPVELKKVNTLNKNRIYIQN